jgi:hypothetical protein
MALDQFHRRTAPGWAVDRAEPLSKRISVLIIITGSLASWSLLILVGAGLLRLIKS